MSQDVISSHEQLSMDEITSPLTAQIVDFCDPQFFQETFNQTSEVTSASNCCGYVENINNNNCLNQDHEDNNNNNNNNDNGDLSIIFDSQDDFDNDITASIDFSSSIQFPASDQLQDQFDFTGVQLHQPPNILYSSSSCDPLPPPLSVFEDDCLSSVPSYNLGSLNPTSPSCSFLGNPGLPTYMSVTGNMMNTGLAIERSGFYSGSLHFGSDFKPSHDQLMEIQADTSGMFFPDSVKPIFNQENHHLQTLDGGENQNNLVATPVLPQLGTDITGLDDGSVNKVAKLTAEQRKEKIHRYMKKRNERNFSKKIKYACRKTLADSRPRVRGRFAKNDELCEPHRHGSSSHHEEDDDDVGVKEEEQLVDSSDIFSHISGVNSFKCSYPIQSWI
ncbi:CCT motif family protein [Raphanus sativus]|uniref:Zinc finger protein HD1-like n=1 Tax=Raphanus sativus TaxID=3726 RepID=A0A6J0LMG7_RAPSA|nr:zinc finger protein HD1-like [Raphanus sativus]KAJ4909519.1 CCT motif family protein [Raphanus sativus]